MMFITMKALLQMLPTFVQHHRYKQPARMFIRAVQCRYLGVASEKTASPDQLPLRTGRPRPVILGTGWAAARLAHDVDPKLYDITVFNPLLASTTVGTLEPRSVAVHMNDIQPALSAPSNSLYIAEAQEFDPNNRPQQPRTITCRSNDGITFPVEYDKLAICTGSQGSTFGIPGVQRHAHFLRDVKQAKAIRQKLIENLALAGIPGRPLEEWQRLPHVVIVGGGPTGVEVAGELTDFFISRDLPKLYPERARAMRVTLIEAKELLGSLNAALREYAARKLIRRGVCAPKGYRTRGFGAGDCIEGWRCTAVRSVHLEHRRGSHTLHIVTAFRKNSCGSHRGGLVHEGAGATSGLGVRIGSPDGKKTQARGDTTRSSSASTSAPKASSSPTVPRPTAAASTPTPDNSTPVPGMPADESDTPSTARLAPVPHVFALGDCCANPDNPLPALAQVAEQQGRYLARVLNALARGPAYGESTTHDHILCTLGGCSYRNLGSMAAVGGNGAVLELGAGHVT